MNTEMANRDRQATSVQPRREQSMRTVVPAVHVNESADGYVLVAALPGTDDSRLHVTVEDRTLTIEAEADTGMREGYRLVREEFPPVRYRAVFELPERVDTKAIDAKLRNGMLRLVLPAREEVKPRRIEVKAA